MFNIVLSDITHNVLDITFVIVYVYFYKGEFLFHSAIEGEDLQCILTFNSVLNLIKYCLGNLISTWARIQECPYFKVSTIEC